MHRLLAGLVGSAVLIAGFVAVQAGLSVQVETWPVPSWRAGDTLRFTRGPDEGTRSEEYTRVLDGPYLLRNERGAVVESYRWVDPERDAPTYRGQHFDLELGRGSQIAGRGDYGSRMVHFGMLGPREGGSQGVALQGLTLTEGMQFDVPNVWSGDSTHFRVVSISSEGALVDATIGERSDLPLWTDSDLRSHTISRYEIRYDEVAPYPNEIRAFVRNNTSNEERQSNLVLRTGMELATGPRVTDRDVPAAGLQPRNGLRFTDWPNTLEPAGSTHPVFDISTVFQMAEEDPEVKEYFEEHPGARLVDLRFGVFRENRNPTFPPTPRGSITAYVWNVTWADFESDAWYSFVRAKYVSHWVGHSWWGLPGPVPEAVGLVVARPANETFADWRTGPFRLDIPVLAAKGPDLHLEPADALAEYRGLADSMPEPVFLRWSWLTAGEFLPCPGCPDRPFKTDGASGSPAYVSEVPAWMIAWGDLGFRFDDETGGTAAGGELLLDTWIVSTTGELVEMTIPHGLELE